MSGHSHWAGIRHHKGINDQKRAAIFTKISRAITVAVQQGGPARNDSLRSRSDSGRGNPDTNFALKLAVDQARAVNMPKDNIERAIKRGTGELKDAAKIEEIVYEGYGPGQAALLIETATDNKNRTVSEVKNILTKTGGKFVTAGSVKFLFERVGILVFPFTEEAKEHFELLALDSGGTDFAFEGERFVVYTEPDNLQEVQNFFANHQRSPEEATLGYRPLQPITLSEKDQAAYEKLRDALEDHPDVQTVWDNVN